MIARLETIPNNGTLRCRTLFNGERLIITSPAALSQIATDAFTFIKPNILRLLAQRVLGLGLVLVNREVHRQQRKLFLPPFAPKHIHDLTPTFWRKSREVTEKMCEEMRNGTTPPPARQGVQEKNNDPHTPSLSPSPHHAVFEVGAWAARVALDIITLTAMGRDFGAIQNAESQLAVVYSRVVEPTLGHMLIAILRIYLPSCVVEALPIKSNHDQAAAMHTIRGLCRELLHEKKETRSDGKDILSVCLRYGDIAGVDEEEVINQMTTFLGAGHETISVGMTWAVYMLCLHPEWQVRLREEIRTKVAPLEKPEAETPSVETLVLVRAFVEEVLRYYPPISLTMREPYEDTELDGRVITKGTRIVVPIKAINRSPQYWGSDARVFRPERWLREDGTFDPTGKVSSKYGHLSFMQGPRSCVAAGFARTEMVCVLAAWMGRFEFELVDERLKDEANMQTSNGNVSAKPLHGLYVKTSVVEGW